MGAKILSGKDTSESQKLFALGGQENQVAGILHPFIFKVGTVQLCVRGA